MFIISFLPLIDTEYINKGKVLWLIDNIEISTIPLNIFALQSTWTLHYSIILLPFLFLWTLICENALQDLKMIFHEWQNEYVFDPVSKITGLFHCLVIIASKIEGDKGAKSLGVADMQDSRKMCHNKWDLTEPVPIVKLQCLHPVNSCFCMWSPWHPHTTLYQWKPWLMGTKCKWMDYHTLWKVFHCVMHVNLVLCKQSNTCQLSRSLLPHGSLCMLILAPADQYLWQSCSWDIAKFVIISWSDSSSWSWDTTSVAVMAFTSAEWWQYKEGFYQLSEGSFAMADVYIWAVYRR